MRAPPAEWVTLPEAIALVSSSLDQAEVQRAVGDALSNGSLVERPMPRMSIAEAQYWSALYPSDANHLAECTVPISASPQSWTNRFSEGRVDWADGTVTVYNAPSCVPVVRRLDVLRLFGAEPKVEARGRPKGTGFEAADGPLVERMWAMVQSGEVKTLKQAAWTVVGEGMGVEGSGGPDSKVARLYKLASKQRKRAI